MVFEHSATIDRGNTTHGRSGLRFTTASNIHPSPMELCVMDCLKSRKIKYYREVMFPLCINPETNCQLRYDFYLPELNMLVEYDGKNFHASLDQKYKDSIKDKFAADNNIKLVRISGGAINLFASLHLSKYPLISALAERVEVKKIAKIKPVKNGYEPPNVTLEQLLTHIKEYHKIATAGKSSSTCLKKMRLKIRQEVNTLRRNGVPNVPDAPKK